jgi:hypothetical protein
MVLEVRLWFRGRLSVREEAALGEPGLAKMRSVLSWPSSSGGGEGRGAAGDVTSNERATAAGRWESAWSSGGA